MQAGMFLFEDAAGDIDIKPQKKHSWINCILLNERLVCKNRSDHDHGTRL